jgi:saccharopine dehydrogenase-like NADP-dependent oxidoreductase
MEKKKIIVLGNGLVGSVIALDMASDEKYDVTVCDANRESLELTRQKSGGKVRILTDVDFASARSISDAVRGSDLCLGAVPGFLGYNMLGAVIDAGVNISDISFMPEDFRGWDGEARKSRVIVCPDSGVAPGMTNILMRYACGLLDEVEDARYYVGGLPTVPEPPFYYKLVFSPDDVIEEYTRPARIKKDGRIQTFPALSGCEVFKFTMPGVDLPEMEGFYTDGCRTLLETIPSPNVAEYTLRYPGTAKDLEFLRSIGLFDTKPIKVKGMEVSPRDVFGALAYPMMKLRPDEKDFTFFRVEVTGKKDGGRLTHSFSLYDEKDMKSGYPSMSRATGFTCAIVGRMILEGLITNAGVNPPEAIGERPEAVKYLLAELEKRGVMIDQKSTAS